MSKGLQMAPRGLAFIRLVCSSDGGGGSSSSSRGMRRRRRRMGKVEGWW